MAWNQDNMSEWGDMSISGLLCQWASTIKIQLSLLILYKTDFIITSLKINLFSTWCSWKIAELALNNNHSLTQHVEGSQYLVELEEEAYIQTPCIGEGPLAKFHLKSEYD